MPNQGQVLISRSAGYALLLLIATGLVYGQFLWNPILFDDLPLFMADRAGNQPVSSYHFSPLELRSLPYASLAWTKAWFGLDMINFRIGNMLLHAAVAIALFFFLTKLFTAVFGEHNANGQNPRTAAFFASLLFALHPVAAYAAGYLVQRTIVMATLFCLLSMLAYVHGSIRQKSPWLWMSVPLYYLAVLSKEHAILLPAVLLALTVLVHDDWRMRLRQRWAIFAALATIAMFVLLAKHGLFGSAYELEAPEMLPEQADSNMNYPLSIVTQSWLFFKYASLWIFPNPAWMSIDMREPFARSLLSPYLLAFIGFIAWGAIALWLLLKRGRMGLAGFALLFPWLMFFTEFSTIRIQEPFVLYRSYLWAVGAFCLLPLLFSRLDLRIAGFILAAIALAMVPISMERLKTFSHPLLLWDDAEKLVKDKPYLPGVYRIYYNRGTELLKINKYDLAIKDLTLATTLYPDWPFSYNNLGYAYMKKGELRAAVEAYSKAIEIADRKNMGKDPRRYYGRAMAYEKMGNVQQALADYSVSCKLANKGCEKVAPESSAMPPGLK